MKKYITMNINPNKNLKIFKKQLKYDYLHFDNW